MQEFLIFLNGLALSLAACLIWYLIRQSSELGLKKESVTADLRDMLEAIQQTHNTLTDNQIAADKKMHEFGLTLVGIQERIRMAGTARDLRKNA
jgi:hypothetical protein